ncbi:MAG: VOC family protein [Candidatus Polarisedimenticolaceae bacterium]|nr:VOC family protein [Candidatus Polarisedimenticolaceae bacterium]
MKIDRLDHLVLTVKDIAVTCRFYTQVMGMQEMTFGQGRKALLFGRQKINLHQQGCEFEPKAARPMPGSADLCFITSTSLLEIAQQLQECGVLIEAGPVARTGAIRCHHVTLR